MEHNSDFKFLLRITDRCEYLKGSNLSKLDINDDSLCEKIKNILYKNRKSINKIKITSDDTFFICLSIFK